MGFQIKANSGLHYTSEQLIHRLNSIFSTPFLVLIYPKTTPAVQGTTNPNMCQYWNGGLASGPKGHWFVSLQLRGQAGCAP